MVNAKERFYEIDLFRFIAALSVVLFHYTFRGYAEGEMSILSFPLLGPYFKYGYLGVDLFFMISGFVVLLTASNKDLAGFVVSRITRLYPAFWIGVTITALVTVAIGGHVYRVGFLQYIANLSMVSGYFGIKQVDGVYWTLLVELKFYFLIAAVLFFNQIKNIKYFLFIWLLVSALGLVVDSPVVRFFLLTKWSSYFIAGAFFYLIRGNGVSAVYLIGITVSYCLSIVHAYWRAPGLSKFYQVDFSPLIVVGIVSVFYVLMFLVSIRKTGMINKSMMLHFGVLTYPLYLMHQYVGFMVFNYFGDDGNKYYLLIVTIVSMLVLSYVVSRYYEKPVALKMKKILLNGLVSGKWRIYG